MKRSLILAALAAVALGGVPGVAAATPSHPDLTWALSETGTTAQLRGLAAVSGRVAWASGARGTVLRTVDSGRTWQHSSPPGSETLELRDIEAFDARTAVALSIGPGDQSRIYRTTDGGESWTESFRNPEPTAFYDCMAFFDRRHGLAMSDPVDGRFRVLRTDDGGASWQPVPDAGMPPALDGEFGFAASGQCLTVAGGRHAWIATGGGATARVLRSADRGTTWTAVDTVLAGGPTAGVYATAFRDKSRGIAVGGDFTNPTGSVDALGVTSDGGRTWTRPETAPRGYRSGVAWHAFLPGVAITVGPTGSDVTLDGGRRWHQFDTGTFDSVDCARDGACWASGARGRVGKLSL
ncbi:WD40/YVTN/BNR-like repeat-containing protein [Actinokineospora sp. 24-640]